MKKPHLSQNPSITGEGKTLLSAVGIKTQTKITSLVTLFVCKLQGFKKIAKMDRFWHFK